MEWEYGFSNEFYLAIRKFETNNLERISFFFLLGFSVFIGFCISVNEGVGVLKLIEMKRG